MGKRNQRKKSRSRELDASCRLEVPVAPSEENALAILEDPATESASAFKRTCVACTPKRLLRQSLLPMPWPQRPGRCQRSLAHLPFCIINIDLSASLQLGDSLSAFTAGTWKWFSILQLGSKHKTHTAALHIAADQDARACASAAALGRHARLRQQCTSRCNCN